MRQWISPADNPEAANFACLGNYAFVYAFLICVGNFGLLAFLATVGVPLGGSFGGIEIERFLFRLFAGATWLIAGYAWLVCHQREKNRCLTTVARLFVIGTIFSLLSFDYGDMANVTIQLLKKVDDCCNPYASSQVLDDSRLQSYFSGTIFSP